MKIPQFIRTNLLLKMTSLNAMVIVVRLFIGFFLQRELTDLVGKDGYAKVGSLRNLMNILMSITSLGVFNGVLKYVAQHKENRPELQKLFSTTFVFTIIGSVVSFLVLFFGAEYFSSYFFYTQDFAYIIKIVAVVVPFISIQRVFNGIVNGLSAYKHYAKIELLAYILGAALTLFLLYQYNIDGALLAIATIPIIQVLVLLFVFVKVLREYIVFSEISFKIPYGKQLLSFTLMSFTATVLVNFVELDLRNMLVDKMGEDDAGIWTAMTTLSQNYMVFSGAIFTLYVIPKFAGITQKNEFVKEVGTIYKTLLPLFALGMLAIYFLRYQFIEYVFIDFNEMAPLFKWQLIGDFIRLMALVLAHQFLAKKMVRNFIFTEILSLALFFGLSHLLVDTYGVEGVVLAHLLRYVIYFFVVLFLVWRYFDKKGKSSAAK
ncbi:O-antigen translocase [Marinirhabdus gelatinilytica]|uniref:PST family polysaccharide transporter n=1 Tax=Marinirhabdus gelatinilytica TaxID=1703343 RepID=A0A370Q4C6_9FLAO|nr:O-antigen translocase [Marinirhabdus gelatinilytica]RDK83238.1 PST family polysaccharide transporter [Marinirhabdus gelatinilytica]